MWRTILKRASFVFAGFPRCSLNSAFIERPEGKGGLCELVGPAVVPGGLCGPRQGKPPWCLGVRPGSFPDPRFQAGFRVRPGVRGTAQPRAAKWGHPPAFALTGLGSAPFSHRAGCRAKVILVLQKIRCPFGLEEGSAGGAGCRPRRAPPRPDSSFPKIFLPLST